MGRHFWLGFWQRSILHHLQTFQLIKIIIRRTCCGGSRTNIPDCPIWLGFWQSDSLRDMSIRRTWYFWPSLIRFSEEVQLPPILDSPAGCNHNLNCPFWLSCWHRGSLRQLWIFLLVPRIICVSSGRCWRLSHRGRCCYC